MDRIALSSVRGPARAPGWQVRYLAATGSTNADAADALRSGEVPPLVVVTDHQQAGRGRLDRGWDTPAGVALTASAGLDPGRPVADWPWLPLLTGLGVVEAVRDVSGVEAGLKWPNDVLVREAKLAGILLEQVVLPAGPLAVLGVGLNVHQVEQPVPGATSLALQGAPVDRADVLVALLASLDARLTDWRLDGGPERLAAAYRERCVTLGREVTAHLPGERSVTGTASDVDEQGRLVITGSTGPVAVGAGDVVHLRPA